MDEIMAFQISRLLRSGQAVGKWTESLKKGEEEENQSAFGKSWDKSDGRGEERSVLCRVGSLLAVCGRQASRVEGRKAVS